MKQGLHGDHDHPQIDGDRRNIFPVLLPGFQTEEDGHHADGQINQIEKYGTGVIVHGNLACYYFNR